MVGEAFAHYRILRELGEGGMGRAHLALDTRLGGRSPEAREAEALGDDDHQRHWRVRRNASALSPHVTIYDIGGRAASPSLRCIRGRAILVELISASPLRFVRPFAMPHDR